MWLKTIPGELLAVLSRDENYRVSSTVAKSPNTPAETSCSLAKDGISYVRRCVAENRNTPAGFLIMLSDDNREDVSLAAQRPCQESWNLLIIVIISVRVVDNPSLPYENLLLMLSDRSKKVREKAEEVLRKRNGSARVD